MVTPALTNGRNGHGSELAPTQIGTIARSAPRTFFVGRDTLELALVDLAPSQQNSLNRFWKFCNDRRYDRARLGKTLKKPNGEYYSTDSIYQLLTGRRAGNDISMMVTAIDNFLAQVEPSTGSGSFILTKFAQDIWTYLDRVKELHAFGFIFGNMSLGKSDAVIEKCRRDPDSLYSRMPTRGGLKDFLQETAPTLAMGDRQTISNLRKRVMDGLPPLWVIDEADQCFLAIRNMWGLATLDFIREAWDYRRRIGRPIGIGLVLDHFGRDQLLAGRHSDRLKRIWRRRYRALQLPNMLCAADLAKFAGAVDLPAAPNESITVKAEVIDHDGNRDERSFTDNPCRLQRQVVAAHGLGVWKQILADSAEIARQRRRGNDWKAVIKAHAIFTAEEAYADQEAANDEEEA